MVQEFFEENTPVLGAENSVMEAWYLFKIVLMEGISDFWCLYNGFIKILLAGIIE